MAKNSSQVGLTGNKFLPLIGALGQEMLHRKLKQEPLLDDCRDLLCRNARCGVDMIRNSQVACSKEGNVIQ